MKNEKGYALGNVGNNTRSTNIFQAEKIRKLKELKPGKQIFVASMSAHESGLGRLIGYAKNLGQIGEFSIGPDGQTDYSYSLKNLPDQTQLFVRRNR